LTFSTSRARLAVTVAAAALIAAAATSPAASATAGEARADLLLPGRWLRGATGAGTWVLTGDDAEGPKQLLEVRWRVGRARAVAALPADATTLVPTGPTAAVELLIGGGGTLRHVTPANGAVRELASGGRVLGGAAAGAGTDTFATAPPWLAQVRLGESRALRLAGGDVQAGEAQALPIEAARKGWGLDLTTPPLGFAGNWLVVGPRAEGRRLRTLLIGPAGERHEHVGLLPEAEQIADTAVVIVDGRPLLVLGTFRGLGLTTKKRLRVFALDGTAQAPVIAREIPAKVWNKLVATAADLDGDGRQELVVAAAEGFSEDTVTLSVFAGRGEGRLATQPAETSVPAKKASWRYGDVTGDGRPDVVTLAEGKLSIHAASGPQGLPSRRPTSTHNLGSSEPPARRQVEVSIGSGGGNVEQSEAGVGGEGDEDDSETRRREGAEEGANGWDLLDLDGDGTLEAVRWEPAPEGRTRLTVVGRTAG
jgi:hypothetical protein